MKRIITLLFLFPVIAINAQVVDINQFDEGLMSSIMFAKMSSFYEQHGFCSLSKASTGQNRIFRFIKRNNERLSLDDLNKKINNRILRKYESRVMKKTNIVGNVGLLYSAMVNDSLTYQNICERCITDWISSENFIFLNWTQVAESIIYYNKRSHILYVFFAYLQ